MSYIRRFARWLHKLLSAIGESQTYDRSKPPHLAQPETVVIPPPLPYCPLDGYSPGYTETFYCDACGAKLRLTKSSAARIVTDNLKLRCSCHEGHFMPLPETGIERHWREEAEADWKCQSEARRRERQQHGFVTSPSNSKGDNQWP